MFKNWLRGLSGLPSLILGGGLICKEKVLKRWGTPIRCLKLFVHSVRETGKKKEATETFRGYRIGS